MDIELPLDFKEFLKLLNANGVRYLLIGGYAVGYHGYPRATNDMDCRPSGECSSRFGKSSLAFLLPYPKQSLVFGESHPVGSGRLSQSEDILTKELFPD